MKKNKPRYKKGRVKKALKRVNKRVGGFSPIKKAVTEYDPTKGYKKGQIVDAGEGAIFKAKTDVKAGTAGLGNTERWERVTPAFQPRTPVNTMQRSPNNRNIIEDPQRVPTGTPITTTPTDTTDTTTPEIPPKPKRGDFGRGQPGYQQFQTALAQWSALYDPNFNPFSFAQQAALAAQQNQTDDSVGDPTGSLDPSTSTDTTTTDEEVKIPDTNIIRTGLPADAPTGIEVTPPDPLTAEQQAAITRDVTKTAVGDVSSQEIKRLQDVAAGIGPGADPVQQRFARERLAQYGISAVNAIQQLGEAPTADAGTVTATTAPTTTVATEDISQGALQSKFAKDPTGRALASTYEADKADAASMIGAEGTLSEGATAVETRADFDEANKVSTAIRERQDEREALAQDAEFKEDVRSQAQKVDFDSPVNIQRAAEAEAAQRKVITDNNIPEGEAAKLINIAGFNASQRRAVTGTAATGEAAEMLVVIGDIPPPIAGAIVEDPATVSAEVDLEPIEVQAAIAALPTEALVSSQMENLLAGIDEGVTPVWARPAVDQVNSLMIARGLSVSTVGRDALFNAIIQTALPIAQSNAQALQQRASQNLSNEQQSNISEANLNAQRRLANLSNRQTAGSQTAQMAQQMATLQSQFSQDAAVTTATQQQQIRIQNLANRQEQAKIQAQLDQQAASQNLGNEQQIELAELQYLNATEAENLNARQQELLVEYQTAADYQAKNAGFTQQMELANLSSEQQVRLSNLSAMNDAARDQMTADQQTELANLQALVTTNVQSAKIAESMGIAKLSADQQTAIFNASTVAKIDLSKFTTEQQVELANSKFMQTSTLTDFSARQQSALQNATTLSQMDIQAADLATKTRISNAQNFLQLDLQNLSNDQQAAVINAQLDQQTRLSNQAAENARLQFNASSQNQLDQFMTAQANQMEQFNTSQMNAMKQFNTSETNRMAAINAGNALQASQSQAQLDTQISQFNTQINSQREQWNAANAQAVEQSNINWRRQANTADTAAANAANQQNVQNSFALTASEQAQYWQQLRDEANYLRQSYENEQTRKAQLYMTAIGNEAGAEEGRATSSYLKQIVDNII